MDRFFKFRVCLPLTTFIEHHASYTFPANRNSIAIYVAAASEPNLWTGLTPSVEVIKEHTVYAADYSLRRGIRARQCAHRFPAKN